jgi:hypothetical protein
VEHGDLDAVADWPEKAGRDPLVVVEDRDPERQTSYRVCGKPRSTFEVAGSGQRDVTTLPRV